MLLFIIFTTNILGAFNDPFEFGDYNGLDHVICQIAIYTDNRNEAGGTGDSRDVYTIGIDKTPQIKHAR